MALTHLIKIYKFIQSTFFKRLITNLNEHKSYESYLNHQKKKTTDTKRINKWLNDEWEIKYSGFIEIFKRNNDYLINKKKALCLGARTGQEVKALQDLGVDAIGIDLVPFPPYTEEGDIHSLKYDDASFDFIFTNIIDHSLYPEKFISEIERVSINKGIIIIHLQLGDNVDLYTETIISAPNCITSLFKKSKLIKSNPISNLHDQMHWECVLERNG